MTGIDVLFFDVLGTIVDWRGSITTEVRAFLTRYGAGHVDAARFADDWVGRYDASVEPLRAGQRDFQALEVLNMENLQASLRTFGLDPAALPEGELQDLNLAWHRLQPWPDAAQGLSLLKRNHVIAPLSDGSTRMLVNVSKRAGLPWDTVLGADIFRAYKPRPEVYLGACALLGVSPDRAMLVAAHDYDLDGARRCGLKTAYLLRDHAADPSKVGQVVSSDDWDYRAAGLVELAELLNETDAQRL